MHSGFLALGASLTFYSCSGEAFAVACANPGFLARLSSRHVCIVVNHGQLFTESAFVASEKLFLHADSSRFSCCICLEHQGEYWRVFVIFVGSWRSGMIEICDVYMIHLTT